MPKKAILSSMLYIPSSALSEMERTALKAELTLEVNQAYIDPSGLAEDKIVKVRNYDITKPGYLGLPRYFGLERFPRIEYVDRTVVGETVRHAFDCVKRIKPRDSQQADFFKALANVCKPVAPRDFIALAKTGSGKTVATINTAIETKRPLLVVVHTNRLKEQWLGNVGLKRGLRFFLGEDFVDDYVGVIQQDRCEFEGRIIGVAMAASLASRRYPDEFYSHWGTVVFDELQKHTAPNVAATMMRFPAAHRGGMTGTLREDVLGRIAHWHFGPVSITSEQEILEPDIYECHIQKTLPVRAINQFSKGSMLTSLTQQSYRQALLAKLIHKRGWKRGRHILVLSDRTRQLQDMRQRLIEYGIPARQLGLYVGEVYSGKFTCRLVTRDKEGNERIIRIKDGSKNFASRDAARRAAVRYAMAHDLTPVAIKTDEHKYKLSDDWYRRMEETCRVLLATYGVFEAGNDVPRLDMGIDISPRSDERQPLGRILRQYPGKPKPEWYTPFDKIVLDDRGEKTVLSDLIQMSLQRRRQFKRGKVRIKRVKDLAKMLGMS